jgi:hypothetical protein
LGLNCGLVVVVDDLDVVAVGVECVRGVVAHVVLRALTRLAVAAVAGRDRIGVEPAYFLVIAREGHVYVLSRLSLDHGE